MTGHFVDDGSDPEGLNGLAEKADYEWKMDMLQSENTALREALTSALEALSLVTAKPLAIGQLTYPPEWMTPQRVPQLLLRSDQSLQPVYESQIPCAS